MRELNLDS